jgi:hypothetical protein
MLLCTFPIPDPIIHILDRLSAEIERRNWGILPSFFKKNPQQDDRTTYRDCYAYIVNRCTQYLYKGIGCNAYTCNFITIYHAFLPQKIDITNDMAILQVTEELDIEATDGCFMSVSRHVALHLQCEGSEWHLCSMRFGEPQLEHCGAALGRFHRSAYRQLWRALKSRDRKTALVWLAEMDQLLPPQSATIAIDNRSMDANHKPVLLWAVDQAIERWNRTAFGLTQFSLIDAEAKPDILIQACKRPVFGRATGVYIPAEGIPRFQALAKRAVIRVTIMSCLHPVSVWASPERLRRDVEHELGHFLGLGDCEHWGRLMGGSLWDRHWSCPGKPEQWALIRYRQRLERCRQQTHDLFGMPGSEFLTIFAPELSFILPKRALPQPSEYLGASLPEAPNDWMALLWEGERLARMGDYQAAVERLLNARHQSPSPYIAEMSIGLTILRKDMPRAIEWLEQALRRPLKGYGDYSAAFTHETLAFAYEQMADERASQWHTYYARLYNECQNVTISHRNGSISANVEDAANNVLFYLLAT